MGVRVEKGGGRDGRRIRGRGRKIRDWECIMKYTEGSNTINIICRYKLIKEVF